MSQPLRQHHAVRHQLQLAGPQPSEDRVPLVLRRLAVDVLGADASSDELVSDVDRVGNIYREADGLAALAVLEPVGNDVADELVGVHAIR